MDHLIAWSLLALFLYSRESATASPVYPLPLCALYCPIIIEAIYDCGGESIADHATWQCFCLSPHLMALYTSPNGICDDYCTYGVDQIAFWTWFLDTCGVDYGATEHTGSTAGPLFALTTTTGIGRSPSVVYDWIYETSSTTYSDVDLTSTTAQVPIVQTILAAVPATYVSYIQMSLYVDSVTNGPSLPGGVFTWILTNTPLSSSPSTFWTTLPIVEAAVTAGSTTVQSTQTPTAGFPYIVPQSHGLSHTSTAIVATFCTLAAVAIVCTISWYVRKRIQRTFRQRLRLGPWPPARESSAQEKEDLDLGPEARISKKHCLPTVEIPPQELPDRALQSPRELHSAHLGTRFPELHANGDTAECFADSEEAAKSSAALEASRTGRSPSMEIVRDLEQRFAARRLATQDALPCSGQDE